MIDQADMPHINPFTSVHLTYSNVLVFTKHGLFYFPLATFNKHPVNALPDFRFVVGVNTAFVSKRDLDFLCRRKQNECACQDLLINSNHA